MVTKFTVETSFFMGDYFLWYQTMWSSGDYGIVRKEFQILFWDKFQSFFPHGIESDYSISQDSPPPFCQILFGCIAQYTIMPAFGLIISKFLGLSPSLSVGLILLGCCPGGTASNVVRVNSFIFYPFYSETILS